MRGIVFALLTFIVGGVIALGLDYCCNFLPDKIGWVFMRTYTVGIHPISATLSICGLLGLIIGYVIIAKFVKK